MKKYTLRIVPNNQEVADMYKNHSHFNEGDSGIDLFCAENITIKAGETKKINFNISCEMICVDGNNSYNVSYLMLPRSSMGSKSPLRLANSIGLIDAFYRGNISGCSDNVKTYDYNVEKGTRLFQLVTPDLSPIQNIEVVKDFLDSSKNRKGGYGSTGK